MSRKEDLRKHPRLTPLIIKAEYESGEMRGEAYVTNLSAGGAFLAVNEPISVGDTLFLVIHLPWNLGKILVGGKVAWRNDSNEQQKGDQPTGVGMEFATLSTEAKEKLHLYIEKFSDLASKIN